MLKFGINLYQHNMGLDHGYFRIYLKLKFAAGYHTQKYLNHKDPMISVKLKFLINHPNWIWDLDDPNTCRYFDVPLQGEIC